jgi:aerobic-type carbon monoxide dehydrogenase small subunit (CoxS/CutS family)
MNARLIVNGKAVTVDSDRQRPLVEVLREDLGLTGTKSGCGEGFCGACTVLIDGKAVSACVTTLAEADGKSVVTIEGLAPSGRLHPVQEAFLEARAFQCGYCTPGMILGTVALLRQNPKPSRNQILRALDGHLCRCCGYVRIVEAVQGAAGRLAAGAGP